LFKLFKGSIAFCCFFTDSFDDFVGQLRGHLSPAYELYA
jgi:hypothetical protein